MIGLPDLGAQWLSGRVLDSSQRGRRFEPHSAPSTYVHSINGFFHHEKGFSQTSQLPSMFQCNEHVEMNKFLCSLACTSHLISFPQLV